MNYHYWPGNRLVCKAHKDRLAALEQTVDEQKNEIAELRKKLDRYQSQASQPLTPRRQSDGSDRGPPLPLPPAPGHSIINTETSGSYARAYSEIPREEGLM